MPIYAIPSQDLIDGLFAGKKNAVGIIKCFFENASRINYSIVLCFPEELYRAVSNSDNPKLKNMKALIVSYRASFLPINSCGFTCHDNTNIRLSVNNQQASTLFFSLYMHFLMKKIIVPIVLSEKDQRISKKQCTDMIKCNSAVPCFASLDFTYPVFSISSFELVLANARKNSLDSRIFRSSFLKDRDTDKLIEHFLDLLLVEKESRKKYKITKGFVRDFEKHANDVLFPLLLSASRVIGFPSARASNAHECSIDFHDDSLGVIEINKCLYKMMRADVVDSLSKDGYHDYSGDFRMLIAVRDGFFFFLCFSVEHDFEREIVISRLRNLD